MVLRLEFFRQLRSHRLGLDLDGMAGEVRTEEEGLLGNFLIFERVQKLKKLVLLFSHLLSLVRKIPFSSLNYLRLSLKMLYPDGEVFMVN